ncbi:Serine/threonine phosphatase stp [Marinomonas spartinae]|uniref:Serine/threonine phosphatase stp n=1 Tax=Marinomonas spartinae TaxID=1792290 RepID=A0A1A8TP34_9GAMM|nr:protein phosphatase 2C domain-containing protein [Marinomonas spartinae]SBS34783.1 Serine/threonine phosphatase stp [Marinomonas spartinae]
MTRTNTSYAISHRGVVRQLNEDSFAEISSHNLWVVADGMGGHEAGDYASQLVVDAIRAKVLNYTYEELTVDHIVSAVKKANYDLKQYSHYHLGGKIAGSTIVILFIKNDEFFVVWAGDSRAYLLRDGDFTQISSDHSQVNELVAQGVISKSEMGSHPLSNVITRAVGVADDINIDVIKREVRSEDMFLLCSDGLTGELSDQEICSMLDGQSVIDTGLALMHSSLVRGAKDNVTCIVVVYNGVDKPVMDDEFDSLSEKTVPLFGRQLNRLP